MTNLQIQYMNALETKRANQANEAIRIQGNEIQRSYNERYLDELSRHNVASEHVSVGQLTELSRSNRAREALTSESNAETRRRNLAQEALTGRQLSEVERHNVRQEQISLDSLAESQRHNVATESATLIDLGERQRHNLASESLSAQQLAEQARANRASESIGWFRASNDQAYQLGQLANQARQIEYNYELGSRNAAEIERSNLARETETNRANLAREQETYRSNRAEEGLSAERNYETRRHNQVVELQGGWNTAANVGETVIKGVGALATLGILG